MEPGNPSRRHYTPGRFVWDPHFSVRQTLSYSAEDNRLEDEPPEPITTTFLKYWSSHLDPPDLAFKKLGEFLNQSDIRDLKDRTRPAQLTLLALLDDRRDPCGLEEARKGQPLISNGWTRSWTSEKYTCDTTSGLSRYRKALDERGLYDKLCEKRSDNRAERRVLLIINLTSLCALALSVNVSRPFLACFREYLQRYILSRVYFRVTLNKATRDFTMEFHLPFCALRQGQNLQDARKLRGAYPMLPFYATRSVPSQEKLFYHEAQISFLITGLDEWYWTAYCCVDSFSEETESPQTYIDCEDDGPSGGTQQEKYPVWNPREYFLMVFSRRYKQITREWGVVIQELLARLDTHESAYHASMDGNDFFDDDDLGRTKSYTKAVSIMRKFNDVLSLSLDTFRDFELGGLQYFNSGDDLAELWQKYLDSIFDDLTTLQYLQRSLIQKIQTFDRMKDGLVNASALKESRHSTKQGKDIAVLTNMTVLYLPCSLATGIFSMTNDGINPERWGLWILALVALAIPTCYVAFQGKLKLFRPR